jgi:hypothetical protein
MNRSVMLQKIDSFIICVLCMLSMSLNFPRPAVFDVLRHQLQAISSKMRVFRDFTIEQRIDETQKTSPTLDVT